MLRVRTASPAFAQGNPTGTISGRVTDPDNLALPGVTVTAAAPVLQGVRTVVTSGNGDYIIPFLPAGDYTVTFEIAGFATVKQAVSLKMADRLPVNVKLALASVTEVVNVQGAASETAPTRTVATTIRADTVERIPLGRTLEAATLLAPTAVDNGPGNAIMISGGLSYDNLNLVNGMNVNDTQRQQPRPLFVEDAIQETKVSAGNISAEYGRFQGGVVNMITKSGGNDFSGSVRVTFTNDAWRALTPYPGDANIDNVVPAYELTFGGPVLRDRLWFFSAGRFQNNPSNITAPYTGFNYTKTVDDKRGEGKITWALNPKNTFKFSYLGRSLDTANDSFSTIMDAASLYHSNVGESLVATNYQSVLSNNLFVEGQYSQRIMDTTGVGSSYMDLLKGTPIWDRSRGQARFSAPTYCAVCPNAVNLLNNYDGYGKVNYFLSTRKFGTHNMVGGFDIFKEMRKNNQNSSASSYRVQATTTIIDGQNIYPVFRTGTTTYVEWLPVFEETQGSDLRTYSGFFNDVWRLNPRLTLSLGVRYDKNSTRDQGGEPVGNASTWSPRLGATYDISGDGRWTANVGYAHYVGLFVTQIADAASSAGRQASYSFYYQGPSVNDGAGPYLNSQQSLQVLFDWFNANGGTGRATRNQPTIPGVNTAVDPGIMSASTDEVMAGVAHEFGTKGSVRVDYLYRTYGQIYGNFLDMSTGVVTDPKGQKFNLTVVNNTDTVERDYKGLSFQGSYRGIKNLQLSGNYSLSFSRGSVEGENLTDVVVRASANEYPEYRRASWNYPVGYLNGDQRHKVRVWGTWTTPVPKSAGNLALGFMQRYDSGLGYDHNMSVDSRPYVTNPGYITPPSTVTYYVSGRGAYRFNGTWRTDLSVSWNHTLPGLTRAEGFFRFVANNVFNNLRVDSFNTTIISRTGDTTLAAFNPFTETPVEGVHWKKGPSYGQPTSPAGYQSPRDFNVSVGIRF
jgi:hypothetical protein